MYNYGAEQMIIQNKGGINKNSILPAYLIQPIWEK